MKLLRRTAQEPKPDRRPKAADVLGMPEDEVDDAPFDPGRDISPEDWEVIARYRDETRKERIYAYPVMAATDVLVHPEKRGHYQLTEEDYEKLKPYLALDDDEEDKVNDFLLILPYLAIIDPGFSMEKLGVTQAEIDRVVFLQEHDLIRAVKEPERAVDFQPDDEKWHKLTRGIMEPDIPNLDDIGVYFLFAGDKQKEYTLPPEAWEYIHEILARARAEGEGWTMAYITFWATILAADKAELVGPGQIKITKRPLPLASSQPLPERPQV